MSAVLLEQMINHQLRTRMKITVMSVFFSVLSSCEIVDFSPCQGMSDCFKVTGTHFHLLSAIGIYFLFIYFCHVLLNTTVLQLAVD